MESLHELFNVADKVDNMIDFDDDGKPRIVDEHGNYPDDISDFLLGVHTLTDLIQEM